MAFLPEVMPIGRPSASSRGRTCSARSGPGPGQSLSSPSESRAPVPGSPEDRRGRRRPKMSAGAHPTPARRAHRRRGASDHEHDSRQGARHHHDLLGVRRAERTLGDGVRDGTIARTHAAAQTYRGARDRGGPAWTRSRTRAISTRSSGGRGTRAPGLQDPGAPDQSAAAGALALSQQRPGYLLRPPGPAARLPARPEGEDRLEPGETYTVRARRPHLVTTGATPPRCSWCSRPRRVRLRPLTSPRRRGEKVDHARS